MLFSIFHTIKIHRCSFSLLENIQLIYFHTCIPVWKFSENEIFLNYGSLLLVHVHVCVHVWHVALRLLFVERESNFTTAINKHTQCRWYSKYHMVFSLIKHHSWLLHVENALWGGLRWSRFDICWLVVIAEKNFAQHVLNTISVSVNVQHVYMLSCQCTCTCTMTLITDSLPTSIHVH